MTDVIQPRSRWLRPVAWIVGIAVLAALALVIFESVGGSAATPYGAFLDQLDAGNVASITFRGTEISGRLKHPSNATGSNGAAKTDDFRSYVPEVGDPNLIAELRKQRVVIDVIPSSSWTRLLAGIPLPMLLFLGFILVAGIVRFMRGGKPQSDAVTPMHPMQGMIGLVSGLFGKQSQAAGTTTHDGDATKGS